MAWERIAVAEKEQMKFVHTITEAADKLAGISNDLKKITGEFKT
jgi:hypothetical protein